MLVPIDSFHKVEYVKPEECDLDGKGLAPGLVKRWVELGSETDVYESLAGPFHVSKKINPDEAQVQMLYLDDIKTERFGEAKIKLSLLMATGDRNIPYQCIAESRMSGYVAHAKDKMAKSGVKIEDEERFKEAVGEAAIYACHVYADLELDDIRRLAGFYFYLGLTLQFNGYQLRQLTEEGLEKVIKQGEKLYNVVVQIIAECPIAKSDWEGITFPDSAIIVHCFKFYLEYAKIFAPGYNNKTIPLLKAMKDMYEHHVSILRKEELSEENKVKFEYFRSYCTWFPVQMETQVLAYNVDMHHYRDYPETRLMIERAKFLGVLIADLFAFKNEIAKYDLPREKNLVIAELIDDNVALYPVLVRAEQLHNRCVEDVIFFGNGIIKAYQADKFVKYFNRLVAAIQKIHFNLKYKWFTCNQSYSMLSELLKNGEEAPPVDWTDGETLVRRNLKELLPINKNSTSELQTS